MENDYSGEFNPMQQSQSVKLFVGQIPREMDEENLVPYFAEFGPIVELTVIRDRITKSHKGCAFVTYLEDQSAHRAIEQLHDKIKLGSAINPLQVRIAECQVEKENKLFIGMLPKTVNEEELHDMFVNFGDLREVHIIRGPEGSSKGCAFVKLVDREAALVAIEEMNNKIPEGSTRPLVVKFADTKKHGKKIDSNDDFIIDKMGNMSIKEPHFWASAADQTYVYPYGYQPGLNVSVSPQQVMPLSYVQYTNHQQATSSYILMNNIPQNYGQPSSVIGQVAGLQGLSEMDPSQDSRRHAMMVHYQRGGSPADQDSNKTQKANNAYRNTSSTQISPASYHNNGGGIGNEIDHQLSTGTIDSGDFDSASSIHRPPEGPAGANLFIYHLPRDLTDADLATLFATFGNVISAKVFVDKKTSDSKGFGFVSFDSIESANAAIAAMNGFQIGSKRLKVQHKRTVVDHSQSLVFDTSRQMLPSHLHMQQQNHGQQQMMAHSMSYSPSAYITDRSRGQHGQQQQQLSMGLQQQHVSRHQVVQNPYSNQGYRTNNSNAPNVGAGGVGVGVIFQHAQLGVTPGAGSGAGTTGQSKSYS